MFVILSLFTFNTIKTFSSFRNVFFFDIKESIEHFASRDNNAALFANSKDYLRLSDSLDKPIQMHNLSSFPTLHDNDFFSMYKFWETGSYIILPERDSSSQKMLDINGVNIQCDVCASFPSNKWRSCYYKIYSLPKFHPESTVFEEYYNNTSLADLFKNGSLKSCSFVYDAYVIQQRNRLYWVIGSDIKDNTEIFFHFFVNHRFLPENRKEYGFIYGGLFKSSNKNQLDNKCLIYAFKIPDSYPIPLVRAGLGFSGTIEWFPSFDISSED